MLTGESMPVDKQSGQLYTGTMDLTGGCGACVGHRRKKRRSRTSSAAVQRAQTSRAEHPAVGDRVSNVFVPIVVLVAIAAALWWGLATESAQTVSQFLSHYLWMPHLPEGPLASALIIGAAVLIVACPCAMGLATPAAIMAASNAAARNGILIRDGVRAVAERLGRGAAAAAEGAAAWRSGFRPVPVHHLHVVAVER